MVIRLFMEKWQGSFFLQAFKIAVIGVFLVFLIHGMRFCTLICGLNVIKLVYACVSINEFVLSFEHAGKNFKPDFYGDFHYLRDVLGCAWAFRPLRPLMEIHGFDLQHVF